MSAGGVSERALKVHDAGLHIGLGSDGGHHIGPYGQPVAADDRTSKTPRFFGTLSQCLVPSPPLPTQSPSTSRSPSIVTAFATYIGRIATAPSRIFAKMASRNTTG